METRDEAFVEDKIRFRLLHLILELPDPVLRCCKSFSNRIRRVKRGQMRGVGLLSDIVTVSDRGRIVR